MFDKSRRGTPRSPESPVDDELERDRFTPAAAETSTPSAARVREAAIIGPSIHIDGDLRGEEDLVIEGTVTGTVHLKDNRLTVGPNGKVRADVYADSIFVDGTVEGDLYGTDRVAIRKTGNVRGNVVAPRVGLDDGAKFKGSIEMDQQKVDAAFGGRSASRKGPEPSKSTGAAAEPLKAAGSGEPKAEAKGPGADSSESGSAVKTGSAG